MRQKENEKINFVREGETNSRDGVYFSIRRDFRRRTRWKTESIFRKSRLNEENRVIDFSSQGFTFLPSSLAFPVLLVSQTQDMKEKREWKKNSNSPKIPSSFLVLEVVSHTKFTLFCDSFLCFLLFSLIFAFGFVPFHLLLQ